MQSLLAIADPTRRRIVELLAARERTAGESVEECDMSAPAISQHLNVLREARAALAGAKTVAGTLHRQLLDARPLEIATQALEAMGRARSAA